MFQGRNLDSRSFGPSWVKVDPPLASHPPCLNSVSRTTTAPSGDRAALRVHPVMEQNSLCRPSLSGQQRRLWERLMAPQGSRGSNAKIPASTLTFVVPLPLQTQPRKALHDGRHSGLGCHLGFEQQHPRSAWSSWTATS